MINGNKRRIQSVSSRGWMIYIQCVSGVTSKTSRSSRFFPFIKRIYYLRKGEIPVYEPFISIEDIPAMVNRTMR
jgi:hypothetical protein